MDIEGVLAIGCLFIGLPWLIFHYITKWKQSGTLTREDEGLLDELHDLARRLDDRMGTIERIIAADNPDFRPDFRPGFRGEGRNRPEERHDDRDDWRRPH